MTTDTLKRKRKGMVAVSPLYAEQHPEAVTKIGDFFYRPEVSAPELEQAKARGERSFETFARVLREREPEVPGEVARFEAAEFGPEAFGFPPPEPPPIERLFPEEDVEAMVREMVVTPEMPEPERLRAEQAQDDFIASIQEIGRTPDTEALLLQLGASEEQVTEFFAPIIRAEGIVVDEQEKRQAVLGLEPEWQSARTGEVITQSEKDRRFPLGHEAELDEWRLTVETGRNYFQVFKVFGESLTKLPKQLGASILQAIQGQWGASVRDKDWADRLIEDANTDLEEFVQEVTEEYSGTRLPIKLTDLATLPQSMAFSLTAMGAGLAVGVPIALIPEPTPLSRIAAWTAGTAASGAVAFNMSSYQIMQIYLEVKNEEMMATVGREITLEEEEQLKRDFSSEAIKYGLWEALPEAVSNLSFGLILTQPLTRIVGRSIASRIIGKLGLLYGEEFLTETITQKGQSDISGFWSTRLAIAMPIWFLSAALIIV